MIEWRASSQARPSPESSQPSTTELLRPGIEARPVLLIIGGPTGTGKSRIALRLAERLDGEIVGCDALQVYRGFDAATAKPTLEERAAIAHHVIDIADPRGDYSLAAYVRDAEAAIAAIAARGRVPIVVGGTGMYLRGLLRGVVPAPARDEALRARLHRMARRFGDARMHRWLARLDPASAARLPVADTQRVARALEIALSTGGTWSERLQRDGTWGTKGERYHSLKFGLDMPRALLADRLDARVDAFFAAGLVREVKELLASGVAATANAFKAIGYREVLAALDAGEAPDSAEIRDRVKAATRRYAKRQRTWWRSEPGLRWLDVSPGETSVTHEIVALWRARV